MFNLKTVIIAITLITGFLCLGLQETSSMKTKQEAYKLFLKFKPNVGENVAAEDDISRILCQGHDLDQCSSRLENTDYDK